MRPRRPLLARAARRWAAVLLAVCTALVAALGALFAHRAEADQLDAAFDAVDIAWFAHRPELAVALSVPGSALPASVLSAALVAACLLTGRLNGAVLAATAVPVSVGLVEVLLKPMVHRTYRGVLTYPSGHTTAVFALATTVAILLLGSSSPPPGRRMRSLVSLAACLLGCLVAMAVVGLRWHYLTDTIAGAAVGTATACGLALTLDRLLGGLSRAPARSDHRPFVRPGARSSTVRSSRPTSDATD